MLLRWALPTMAAALLAYATVTVTQTAGIPPRLEPPAPPPESAFAETVSAVGLIEPASENIAIGAHVPGVVTHVHVRAGDHVDSGARLFSIDAREVRAQLVSARARIVVAEAAIAEAETDLGDRERELAYFRRAVLSGSAASTDEVERSAFAEKLAAARLESARARLDEARASAAEIETTLERLIVRAPIAGEVLQVNIRPGEFAVAGAAPLPLMIMGDTAALHVRADIDETRATRVRAGASAAAVVRGDPGIRIPLRFVRFEPLVTPKRSLSGAPGERVDTRVLQAIYAFDPADRRAFVGQQVDVFIDASSGGVAAR